MRRAWRLLILLLVVAVGITVYRVHASGPSIAPGSLLVLDLGGSYVEEPEEPLFARLTGRGRTPLIVLLSQLRKASLDDRLATVVLHIRPLEIGWAKAQEIRDAIADLRDKGRHPIAYLEIESYGANLEYYVASAAEEVWLAPGTRTPFVGLAAEYFFLGGFWEKIGVEIDVERIGEFKSAAESIAGKEMSEPHRLMANALLDSTSEQFVAGVAAGRGISEDDVRKAIDDAPVTPDEMKSHRLVDGTQYLDELVASRSGGKPAVKGREYAAVDPRSVGFDPKATFALVYGAGSVVQGDADGPQRNPRLASETVSRALREAAEDSSIAAIIFRIDSPGGSALASDVVWHAVQEARKKKPVVASMSDLAASGGYYVACGADAIVAQPATLTGSIGVFVLRPIVSGMLEKLGIGFTSLQRGAHADLLLSTQQLSASTRERMQKEVRSVYDQFVGRVAEGRQLDAARVDELGRGRVWTGAQAKAIGLVDELGGLRKAVELAKVKAKVDGEVALLPYPPPKPLAVQIQEALQDVGVHAATRALALPELPSLVRLAAAWIAALPERSPALLPPFAIEIR